VSRTSSGFTVIELIATIAILAIVAAVSLPHFASETAFAGRGYADEIAGALRHARAVAIASSCDVRFTINNAGYSAVQRTLVGNVCNGAFGPAVRRADNTNLAGQPPGDTNVAAGAILIFDGETGALQAPPPPALIVGPFSVTLDRGGWVQVQ
jgi:prepilin-type N-terminal cleavage/methylation domain-containing protein